MTREDDRLRRHLLETSADLDENALLRLALQHIVMALGGLGGLAHLTELRENGDSLRLVATTGLPADLVHLWENLQIAENSAPGRAALHKETAWAGTWPPTSGSAHEGSESPPAGWSKVGALSVPLLIEDRLVGTISTLLGQEPLLDRQEHAAELALVIGRRLAQVQAQCASRPQIWRTDYGSDQPSRALATLQVATWEWQKVTGVKMDDTGEDLVRLAGLTPHTWDHRPETWLARIHPDDRTAVLEETKRAVDTREACVLEYRVLDANSQVNWIEQRGQFVYAENGIAERAYGTLTDVTLRRDKLEWLTTLQELHPDPVFAMSTDNRVAWGNMVMRNQGAARGVTIVGAVPWEVDEALAGLGLQEMLARARAAGGTAITHELQILREPETGAMLAYSARAAQVGEYVTVMLEDITERKRAEEIERARTRELWRTLKPKTLPQLVAVTVAARHVGGRSVEIGGSWYDAIQLAGGRVMLVSGSVTGDGLSEAITMGQLRATVAELAALDYPLAELMTRIGGSEVVTSALAGGLHAILLLALYDATTGRLSLVSAEHPPPVLAAPALSTKHCDLHVGPGLGASPLAYEITHVDVRDGSLLALSTTGFTGRQTDGESLRSKVTRLLDSASPSESESSLEEVCDAVADLTRDEVSNGDAAVLLSCLTRVPQEKVAAWDLPWDPKSSSGARRKILTQVCEWGREDLAFTAELVVSELVGNVIRHTEHGPLRLRLLHLDHDLVIEVYDGSQSMPRMQPIRLMEESGRGLMMIGEMAAAMNGSWGARYTRNGKCIWVRLRGEQSDSPGAAVSPLLSALDETTVTEH
ncbi:SpoIIE family protein phosphatase [Streptomyces sp. ME01-18a]|uniref:ATP-binding SpoIIE family protein phosphatase n=1 Tax=Streptomyces sp. ME01-18a TaxID=3028669 RepID=UPI0029A5FF79|nr:SpoIIE family protein phosphatase [Streptomyces sp. ME01-18a]MDX3433915.1 SpoIIE family protein phosphatase [Streptomyces sp. ME01-18a]